MWMISFLLDPKLCLTRSRKAHIWSKFGEENCKTSVVRDKSDSKGSDKYLHRLRRVSSVKNCIDAVVLMASITEMTHHYYPFNDTVNHWIGWFFIRFITKRNRFHSSFSPPSHLMSIHSFLPCCFCQKNGWCTNFYAN